MQAVLATFLDEIRSGRRAVLATIVKASGSTPRTVGARMVIRADGSSSGTIGAGEDAIGMACGGAAEVLLEPSDRGARLVVFGAGHVGLALARLASTVGFAPELVDDRAAYCEAARAAGVGRVFPCDADYAEGLPDLDEGCYVAVVTRCHRIDRLALRRVLGRPLRYVGLIGSRRKKTVIFRELAEQDGIDEAALARVRCPIGLPIGGDTPEEIAVSIVAELMQVRSGGA
jgi:xanthine dehydrogenase accessory factor